jgi:aminopeptidase YwaD
MPLLQFSHGRVDPGGRYWFWHTTEDTFDKIDFGILAGDTKLYVAALSRLLMNAIPPIRLAAATEELTERLEERKGWAGDHFDLSSALIKADELHRAAQDLDRRLATYSGASTADIVRRMVRVIRPVLRVTYERNGPYHQDPALQVPTLPGLAPLETLSKHPRGSDLYRFTQVHLVRERNRLEDNLDQAIREARALSRVLDENAR